VSEAQSAEATAWKIVEHELTAIRKKQQPLEVPTLVRSGERPAIHGLGSRLSDDDLTSLAKLVDVMATLGNAQSARERSEEAVRELVAAKFREELAAAESAQ